MGGKQIDFPQRPSDQGFTHRISILNFFSFFKEVNGELRLCFDTENNVPLGVEVFKADNFQVNLTEEGFKLISFLFKEKGGVYSSNIKFTVDEI